MLLVDRFLAIKRYVTDIDNNNNEDEDDVDVDKTAADEAVKRRE